MEENKEGKKGRTKHSHLFLMKEIISNKLNRRRHFVIVPKTISLLAPTTDHDVIVPN